MATQTRSGRSHGGAGHTATTPLTDHVLTLQREAGNAAVTSLLGGNGPVVQRFSLGVISEVLAYVGIGLDLVTLPLKLIGSADREMTVLETLVGAGVTDPDKLANIVFLMRYPMRMGKPLEKSEKKLIAEWKKLKRTKVKTALGTESGPMSEAKKKSYIEKAKAQAKLGNEDLTEQMEAALPEGTSVDDWFAGIEPDAKFLGQRIRASDGVAPGVHREMRERLDAAATHLRGLDKFAGKNDTAIRKELGIRDIGGLRKPKAASGSDGISLHCFGMAVDINPDKNPFIGLDESSKEEFKENESPKIIGRAMWLVKGQVFNVKQQLQDEKGRKLGAAASWDKHHAASDALIEYMGFADDLDGEALKARVDAVRAAGDTHDLEWWKKRIGNDRKLAPYYDFGKKGTPEKTGYMDLTKDLIVALDAAGLVWGGTYNAAKDIMHFGYDGSIHRTGKKK